MKKLTLLLALCFCLHSLTAQWSDDFSDGNFTDNPVWSGDVANFVVNAAGELQLMAPDAGTSALYSSVNLPFGAVWDMQVRLEFAPSLGNALRIALMATNNAEPFNGYFLLIGENGSTDALRLLRYDNGVPTELAAGTVGAVANEPVEVRIRVTRSSTGVWSAELAPLATGIFTPQFSVSDLTYLPGPNRWVGFVCTYTATRKDKYYFDNLSISADLNDIEAPQIVEAIALNAQQVQVIFNEPVDSLSASDLTQYTLLNNNTITAANWNANQPNVVTLNFSPPLANGATYQVRVAQIKDIAGNIATDLSAEFDYFVPDVAIEGDIIINEIMADPTPSVGLPDDAEWIELYNRSDKIIALNQLRLVDGGGTPISLPEFLLRPDSFVVLAKSSATLGAFTNAIAAFSGFPSISNEGEPLSLTRADGTVIDRLEFDLGWYMDNSKSDGGWTLERINPLLVCSGRANWRACPALPGGSPGTRNLAFNDSPDVAAPIALGINYEANINQVQVQFSEPMEFSTALNPANYRFTPDLSVGSITFNPQLQSRVNINLSSTPATGVVYQLSFTPDLSDCAGNSVQADTLKFGVTERPDPFDVVINEILFNPATGGSRYVEVYNRSNKIIALDRCFLANFRDGAVIRPILANRLLTPGDYVVFSASVSDLQTRYPNSLPNRLLPVQLPTFDDNSDNVTFYWTEQGQSVVLDSVDYEADWHNALLSSGDREGVALERISTGGGSNDPSNWTSAARLGSPTLPNTQSAPATPVQTEDWLTLSNVRISPDDDGFEDFILLQANLNTGDNQANVLVFDSEGVPVKTIVRQAITGTDGSVRWDGDLDNGARARPGIYILYVELFNANGEVRRAKRTVAVVF
jgi:Lamin Tail Domain/Bacterial Ig-like domain